MFDYIKEKVDATKRKENTLHGRDIVLIINPLPEHVSIDNVMRRIESMVPAPLTKELDAIYVGAFKILKDRDLQALYYHGTIYVTNEQDNENDLYNDLIHEISHSIETLKKEDIYADGDLEKEFMDKRLQLHDVLVSNGYDITWSSMDNPQYEKYLDSYLYNTVGYDILGQLIGGIFVSPYSATSIREYWAKGYEAYTISGRSELKKVSPVLYGKIEKIHGGNNV